MFEIFDIMACEFPAVLCDPETFEVKKYNTAADLAFSLGSRKEAAISYEVYELSGEDLLWYRGLPLQTGLYDFRPVKSLRDHTDVVLDCVIVETANQ